MPLPPKDIRACAERYLVTINSRDPDAIAAMCGPEVTFEDPVGTPARVGQEGVRAMFQGAREHLDAMKLTRISPISVAENVAAFALTATTEMGGRTTEINVIDLLAFDDDGRLVKMQAFWNEDDTRTTPSPS